MIITRYWAMIFFHVNSHCVCPTLLRVSSRQSSSLPESRRKIYTNFFLCLLHLFPDSLLHHSSSKNFLIVWMYLHNSAAGYNYCGSEPLYSGVTGKVMQAEIFVGVVYYQRLRYGTPSSWCLLVLPSSISPEILPLSLSRALTSRSLSFTHTQTHG